MFFDELRPPPARPGQFEEAHWPEEGGGGADGSEGRGRVNAGVADGAFEEVTLPEVDEDGHKMDAAMSRRQRRKLRSRVADEVETDGGSLAIPSCACSIFCVYFLVRHPIGFAFVTAPRAAPTVAGDALAATAIRCARALSTRPPSVSNVTPLSLPVQGSGGVARAMKSLDPLDTQTGSALEDKDGESKVANCARTGAPSWERSFPSADDEEADDGNKGESPPSKRKREEEVHPPSLASSCIAPVPQDLPVCAKNISVTPSGEKVILWTRCILAPPQRGSG